MGNRSFLNTTDRLPAKGEPAPDVLCQLAEGNNFPPPLWRVLFSAAVTGPAQDHQQIFLESVCDGLYAERTLAEQRLHMLLAFLGTHPLLRKRELFLGQTPRQQQRGAAVRWQPVVRRRA
jgi:hypothetical protein